MPRRKIAKYGQHALSVHREGLPREPQLVYIACANRRVKYPAGLKSRVVYIGTTERGVARIAESAAKKTTELLTEHGFKTLHFFVVKCRGVQSIAMWEKLESALLMEFRDMYGVLPRGNHKISKKFTWASIEEHFVRSALRDTLLAYD
ncbi:MAG: hypothetical protein KF745_02745 [Phycisphaeraceae bacterium]|nr:hypothetical protein [Phycisphaeraceae bacterium]